MHAGLSVRVMEDSNYMMVLDLLSVLTGNDRKKASQTLARISARTETADLLTLRHSPPCSNKKTPRKLISFPNAIQLLLVLPKRTVDLQTRRAVAGILADYFEAPLGSDSREGRLVMTSTASQSLLLPPTPESLAMRQTLLQIEQQTADLEHQRRLRPLENLKQCMDLMKQCGPLSEDELREFRRAVAVHMPKGRDTDCT